MKIRSKIAMIIGTACLALTGIAQATPASAVAGCPVGDGPSSWGKAKVCPHESVASDARVHIQDSLTDGYCVVAKYYSPDQSRWREVGPVACTTGQWVTFVIDGWQACESSNLRLYRGNGNFFTIPNTYC